MNFFFQKGPKTNPKELKDKMVKERNQIQTSSEACSKNPVEIHSNKFKSEQLIPASNSMIRESSSNKLKLKDYIHLRSLQKNMRSSKSQSKIGNKSSLKEDKAITLEQKQKSSELEFKQEEMVSTELLKKLKDNSIKVLKLEQWFKDNVPVYTSNDPNNLKFLFAVEESLAKINGELKKLGGNIHHYEIQSQEQNNSRPHIKKLVSYFEPEESLGYLDINKITKQIFLMIHSSQKIAKSQKVIWF